MKPTAYLLLNPGTNCHHETAYAIELAGAVAKIITIYQVITGKVKLYDCDLFFLAGGFSWGDHIRAGVIAANDLVYRFRDQVQVVLEKKIPILGICNGFQILVAAGLFSGELGDPDILLDLNEVATFQHWTQTEIYFHQTPGAVWTKGLGERTMKLPVAHAEGKVTSLTDKQPTWQIAATYGSYEGTTTYPDSPNGGKIAAVSYQQITGIMPHPERALFDENGREQGLLIFRAGVDAVK